MIYIYRVMDAIDNDTLIASALPHHRVQELVTKTRAALGPLWNETSLLCRLMDENDRDVCVVRGYWELPPRETPEEEDGDNDPELDDNGDPIVHMTAEDRFVVDGHVWMNEGSQIETSHLPQAEIENISQRALKARVFAQDIRRQIEEKAKASKTASEAIGLKKITATEKIGFAKVTTAQRIRFERVQREKTS